MDELFEVQQLQSGKDLVRHHCTRPRRQRRPKGVGLGTLLHLEHERERALAPASESRGVVRPVGWSVGGRSRYP